jgi:hypothetical protein
LGAVAVPPEAPFLETDPDGSRRFEINLDQAAGRLHAKKVPERIWRSPRGSGGLSVVRESTVLG